MRRWLVLFASALALLLVGVPAALFVRVRYFPPRFDVPSIAKLPEHKDPALLRDAWALPVAKTFAGRVDYQPNGSVCGPTSLANVFRSLGEGPTSPSGVLAGTDECPYFDVCWGGLSLDALAGLLRSKSTRKVTVLRGLSLDEFREHLTRTNDPSRRYVVNFNRGLLFGEGGGHHSPVAGYLAGRDLVFVLDVNEKFGPWLVPTERLFRAVDSADTSTHQKRGLLLVE